MPHSTRTHSDALLRTRLLKLTDATILGTLTLVPLAMGGRQPLGQWLLAVLTVTLVAAWLIYMWRHGVKWQWTSLHWVSLAMILVGGVALLPIGESWLTQINPKHATLLPLWIGGEAGSDWSTLSLSPYQTERGFVHLVAYVLVFLVLSQRFRSIEDVERALKWVAITTAGMAVIALLQFFIGNGKFLWVYEHPRYTTEFQPKGTFGNSNHFGQFVALGVCPLLYWVVQLFNQRQQSAQQRGNRSANSLCVTLLCLALVAMAFAVLRSESRGGVVALMVAASFSILLFRQGKAQATWLLLGGCGFVLSIVLLLYGEQFLHNRVTRLFEESFEQNADTRRLIWEANERAIRDFPLTGTGIGTHAEVYPRYFSGEYSGREFTHAECGYLQVLQENGIPGLVLLGIAGATMAGMCIIGLRRTDSVRAKGIFIVVLAAMAVSAVHSIGDFVWYIPGCVVPLVVLMACGQRMSLIVREARGLPIREFAVGTPLGIPIAVFLLGVGTWMVTVKWPPVVAERHFEDYLFLCKTVATSPKDLVDITQQKIAALAATVDSDPYDHRAHLRLAEEYRLLFRLTQNDTENRMDESQIRDAVYASGFGSIQQVKEWMTKAIGDSAQYLQKVVEHSKAAIELCPLHGRAYANLSSLAFLVSLEPEMQERFMSQALLVRPFDPFVLFEAGKSKWLAGDTKGAIAHWKQCFHKHAASRKFIVSLLAEHVTAEFWLKEFEPETAGLGLIEREYVKLDRESELPAIRQALAAKHVELAKTAKKNVAARHLLSAYRQFAKLKNDRWAEACITAAHQSDRQSYPVRIDLARWYLRVGKADDAKKHLMWCRQRKPDDISVRQLLKRIDQAPVAAGAKKAIH